MIHPPQLTTLSTTRPGSAADQHTRTERDECRTSKRCRRPGRAVSRAGAVRRHLRSNRQAHPPFAYPSTGTEHAGLRPCAARRDTPAPGTSTTAQQQDGAGHGHFYHNHRIRPDGLEDNGRPAAEIVDCRATECHAGGAIYARLLARRPTCATAGVHQRPGGVEHLPRLKADRHHQDGRTEARGWIATARPSGLNVVSSSVASL